MSYCDGCEYYDECEYAGMVNFCDDCKDGEGCGLRTVWCEAGHDIECNNGFEVKAVYADDEDGDGK